MRPKVMFVVLLANVGCLNLTGRAMTDASDASDASVNDLPDVLDIADDFDASDASLDAPTPTDAPDSFTVDTRDDTSDAPDGADDADAPQDACGYSLCGGACIDTQTDPHHCGSCDRDCAALPNVTGASVRCEAGACVIPPGACDGARGDCDGDAANGCEADLTRPETCGACATRCVEPAPTCSASGGCANVRERL
jgi:hypothetical protein